MPLAIARTDDETERPTLDGFMARDVPTVGSVAGSRAGVGGAASRRCVGKCCQWGTDCRPIWRLLNEPARRTASTSDLASGLRFR